MVAIAMFAAAAALNWTMPDGKVVSETQELVPFEDGVRLELSRDAILSKRAKRDSGSRRTASMASTTGRTAGSLQEGTACRCLCSGGRIRAGRVWRS